ncbi:hypothetical protein ESZ50_00645 [Weissella muntiaci]|uniref:Uncharacterized protein n=1 Tax=Weissella muntiaci TaxID=2508881 RepID=A0A6C2CCX5_9LACO|nr:hypothetical protein [Weissella muntiaci]TYC51075.1 hypothetical protein ESZ50_00645 [Weissella muntiaci]
MINNYLETLQQTGQDGVFLFLLIFVVLFVLIAVAAYLLKYLFIIIGRDLYVRHLRKQGKKIVIR